MPVAGRPEDLEETELLTGFQVLFPQLKDIYSGAEHGIEETAQVALALPCARAQVQPGRGEPGPQVSGHAGALS